ncbi:MAG: hypothetical protein HEQ39_17820 [Rhizobacter sp.]
MFRHQKFWTYVLTVFATTALPLPATSQTLYRCGNEFSQTPCSKDAPAARIRSSAAPDRPETPGGKDLCIAQASKMLGFAEPQPEVFDSVNKMPAQVIQYAGTPIAAKTYWLQSRGRIHQGILVPAVSLECFLSDDEQRLLKLEPAARASRKP